MGDLVDIWELRIQIAIEIRVAKKFFNLKFWKMNQNRKFGYLFLIIFRLLESR